MLTEALIRLRLEEQLIRVLDESWLFRAYMLHTLFGFDGPSDLYVTQNSFSLLPVSNEFFGWTEYTNGRLSHRHETVMISSDYGTKHFAIELQNYTNRDILSVDYAQAAKKLEQVSASRRALNSGLPATVNMLRRAKRYRQAIASGALEEMRAYVQPNTIS